MDTIESLIRKGYRVYNINMRLTSTLKHYFKIKKGLQVEFHQSLKVITVKDAES